ncbi:hypothetical protein [Azospirillum argentinense]|uniref:hypothetical protein n=1 Tax=Azospirillum argentinense TaxID=2970906 RepID=UPI0032DEFD47
MTLKDFEEALRAEGMADALDLLARLKADDRAKRTISPPRRIVAKKMTRALALEVLELHRSTRLTQLEIAVRLGINQGRVNEVIKRRKRL